MKNQYKAFATILLANLLTSLTPAHAITEDKLAQSLLERIEALEATVNTQQALLDYFSLTSISDPNNPAGYDTIRISGANLQIVNGLESTNTLNGTGNLIVGYNTGVARSSCSDGRYGADAPETCKKRGYTYSNIHRSGSHNIVTGSNNNYSQYGGLVAGVKNTINSRFASVTGGGGNNASGRFSNVSGGRNNSADGQYSSVSGGSNNTADGNYGSVLGGSSNTASGTRSSVSGGEKNTASSANSSVSGGNTRTASGNLDWVAGSLLEDE